MIVHREIVHGKPWFAMAGHVVVDEPEQLVVHVPGGAPFGFPPGPWHTPDGRHPWQHLSAWEGHGVLMVLRPDVDHAVWHFWTGPGRAFACWYVNFQEPFRRTAVGYDTSDLELDLVMFPDGSWTLKDWDLVDTKVERGVITADRAEAVRAEGLRLGPRVGVVGAGPVVAAARAARGVGRLARTSAGAGAPRPPRQRARRPSRRARRSGRGRTSRSRRRRSPPAAAGARAATTG